MKVRQKLPCFCDRCTMWFWQRWIEALQVKALNVVSRIVLAAYGDPFRINLCHDIPTEFSPVCIHKQ